MGQKLVLGPINKGIRKDRTAFNIDNDSFPVLQNAYQWRGRVKRKRGTAPLGRLQRNIGTTDSSGDLTITILPVPIAIGIVSFVIGTDVFYDPGGTSPVTLITNSTGSAILDRSSGELIITGSQATTAVIYFPGLPVLGLKDLILTTNQFPGTLAFDTDYSYNISTNEPYAISDVSYYKNPPDDPTNLPSYTQKTIVTPTTWNGADYQQFWTVNYQGALWATNGIGINSGTFSTTTIGMQFSHVTAVAAPSATTVIITLTGSNLVPGDFVFFNEFDPAIITGINFQTGYVTAGTAPGAVTFKLPFATMAGPGGTTTKGIVQYLTNRSNVTKDCLRWYDGNPNTTNNGWVNFAPPLSQDIFSIADLPQAQYYLVGARMIVPFKDRLCFLGPVIQTSSGSPIYLQDTVIYSQNGTPYYTCSYTNSPDATIDTPTNPPADPGFVSLLVPDNQTATPSAYFEDSTGFGGFITAGLDQPITTVSSNEDVLILGLNSLQTRMVYSGNDIVPFNFFTINSELGSASTFSVVNMDQGVISRGNRGFIITSQTQAQRIDLEIPDQVFEISLMNNGTERVCSQRDFINEWIYFSYPSNEFKNKFPNQTLQYNYRDESWAIFNECYTTYGIFRRRTGQTWGTLPANLTWKTWNTPWNSGSSTLLQQQVIAGNQQGYIVFRDEETGEADSLSIQNFTASQISSPNHGLNNGDYVVINNCLGTIGTQVNGKVFKVQTITNDTFVLNPSISTGTYLGGGTIKRLYIPLIQTKQFPAAWDMARKTRIGVQQYLFSTTENSQITLLIYLSQNSSSAYNEGLLVPDLNSKNNSLIYSTVLYTCPESTNLGLTPANINLQMVTASDQQQIWHRMNTSLIGDTVQIGFTLSEAQMRDPTLTYQTAEIVFHGAILDLSPSMRLA